jgi:arsenate reductase
MAEGWARTLRGSELDAYSAGLTTHGLNARAVAVMREAGVDISNHHSKLASDLEHIPFDLVVTVCDHASETCPAWLASKARIVHQGFDDPPRLTVDAKTDDEALTVYRRVRDEIRAFIPTFPL